MSNENGSRYSEADIAAHAAAVQRAVREATLTHARLGRPVVGIRNGQIIWLTPEEVIAAANSTPTPENPPTTIPTAAPAPLASPQETP